LISKNSSELDFEARNWDLKNAFSKNSCKPACMGGWAAGAWRLGVRVCVSFWGACFAFAQRQRSEFVCRSAIEFQCAVRRQRCGSDAAEAPATTTTSAFKKVFQFCSKKFDKV